MLFSHIARKLCLYHLSSIYLFLTDLKYHIYYRYLLWSLYSDPLICPIYVAAVDTLQYVLLSDSSRFLSILFGRISMENFTY